MRTKKSQWLLAVALGLVAVAGSAYAEASEEVVVYGESSPEADYAAAYEYFCMTHDCQDLGVPIFIPGSNVPPPSGPRGRTNPPEDPVDEPCRDEWDAYQRANTTYEEWEASREASGHEVRIETNKFDGKDLSTTNGGTISLNGSYSVSTGLIQYTNVVFEGNLVSVRGSFLQDRRDDLADAYEDCMGAQTSSKKKSAAKRSVKLRPAKQ